MKFTIHTNEVRTALKTVIARSRGKKAFLTITATDGKLIIKCGDNAWSSNTSIEGQGQLEVPAKVFQNVLDTYAGKPELQLEADASGLRLESLRMPATSWNPTPTMPSGF